MKAIVVTMNYSLVSIRIGYSVGSHSATTIIPQYRKDDIEGLRHTGRWHMSHTIRIVNYQCISNNRHKDTKPQCHNATQPQSHKATKLQSYTATKPHCHKATKARSRKTTQPQIHTFNNHYQHFYYNIFLCYSYRCIY